MSSKGSTMNRDGASPRPAVKPGPGLFVAAVVGIVAASAGCSTSPNTPSPASTPTVHETTSAQSTVVGPSANPATATADPTFVGHWHVHGATMDISPATATIVANNGPCGPGAQGMCHETDALTVASSDSAQLTRTSPPSLTQTAAGPALPTRRRDRRQPSATLYNSHLKHPDY